MRKIPLLFTCGALLTFIACASAPPSAVEIADSADAEICASDVRPPVPRLDENPVIQAPTVTHRVMPVVDRSIVGHRAEATVEAVIGEDGIPRNVCFVSGNRAWGRALVEAVRKWRFRPALSDGKPTMVIFQVTMTFRG